MAKERERRYASVADLGRDLENFLADRPILARPPSAIYQLRKFTRRNRALMTSVMLTLVLVLGGAIAVGWQNIQIREAKAQADTEKVRAEKATSFLTQVISEANALDQRGPDFTVREALEEAAGRIETELVDQPLIAADIHHVIGVTFRKMSLYDRADTHLTTAWTTRKRVLGADHQDTIGSLGALSFLRWQQDRRKEAVQLGQQWLEASQRVLGEDDPETLAAAHTMALYLRGQGHLVEAEAAYRKTLDGRRQVLGPDDEATLQTMHNLGRLLMDRGEFEEAGRVLEEVLEVRRRVLGRDHADTLMTWDLIGELLQERGKIPEAEAIHEHTLAGLTSRLGPEHVATLGAASNLIVTRMRMAKMTDLETLVPTTLAGCKRVFGDGHRQTLILTRILGALRMQQGKLDESIELFRAAYAATRKTVGEDEPVTRRAASDLAYALQAGRRFKEAAKVTQALVREFADVGGQLDESHAAVYLSHGLSLIGLRRFEDAEKTLLRCREVAVAAKSEQSQAALAALNSLVRLYRAWDKPEQVKRYQMLVDEWGK
ncbi:MAG: tetratricopeptide repeat protein [Planctomycetota bacterium]|jgi:tetratricopeptide (TPR) repeat protein